MEKWNVNDVVFTEITDGHTEIGFSSDIDISREIEDKTREILEGKIHVKINRNNEISSHIGRVLFELNSKAYPGSLGWEVLSVDTDELLVFSSTIPPEGARNLFIYEISIYPGAGDKVVSKLRRQLYGQK